MIRGYTNRQTDEDDVLERRSPLGEKITLTDWSMDDVAVYARFL
jgi:hypothetical protein